MIGPDEDDLGNDLEEEVGASLAEAAATQAPEPESKATAEKPEPKNSESGSIPYPRFKEVNEENRAIRARLAELESKLAQSETPTPAPVPEKTLKELTRQKNDKLLEGDLDAVDAIEAEIHERLTADATKKAYDRISAEQAAAKAKLEEETIAQMEDRLRAEHPELDPDSPKFDEKQLHSISSLCGFYIKKGKEPAEALKLAASELYPDGNQGGAPAKKPQSTDVASVRARIPPSIGSVGAAMSDKERNRSVPSESEWNKLSHEEQQEILGNA